jgi:hypothetical protein
LFYGIYFPHRGKNALTFCLKLIFLDSDGEIVSESEYEQSEDEIFRNVNKFVEIEYKMEYN